MSATALLRGRHPLTSLNFPSRAASLTSAIGRGIRRSKGVGFRGKEHGPSFNDYNHDTKSKRTSVIRRTAEPKLDFVPRMTRDAWSGKESSARIFRGKKELRNDQDPRPRRSRASRFNDVNSSFGKRSAQWTGEDRKNSGSIDSRGRQRQTITRGRASTDRIRESGRDKFGTGRLGRTLETTRFADSKTAERGRVPADSRRVNDRFGHNSQDNEQADVGGRQYTRKEPPTNNQARFTILNPHRRDKPTRRDGTSQQGFVRNDFKEVISSRDSKMGYDVDRGSKNGGFNKAGEYRTPRSSGGPTIEQDADRGPKSSGLSTPIDNRIPVSIPYTTPASEFLYGTSVVEAALLSQRTPKRKLYKLYIYIGENRDNLERDAGIERLARKNGVEVVRVDGNGIRLMDKMSGGRPHNGYILEASPLPRLPITSLGDIKDGGFSVTLDHQSREEAAINGTSEFISVPRDSHGRNPLVLLLDSILDPGNLGGIIRTASFLGVSAIAISNRNSASFTPVVLKASAGASENITLFSVSKPAGFINDSKLAGWKIYAAVAPGNQGSNPTPLVTTDALQSPLEQDACVLMLGSEGEGLRWNLRSKADVELAIQGSGQRLGVDSLNVSVATGILCNAFLRNPSPVTQAGSSKAERDLF